MQTILHIGMPKTGSTVLQDRLRGSRETLLARGMLYPSNPPGCRFNNHRLLLTGFLAYDDLPRHMHKSRYCRSDDLAAIYAAFRAQIAREVDETRPERLILSSESLFRPLGAAGPAALRAALAPYGAVTVAVYLRRPSAYYLSALQQRLKASQRVGPPRLGSPLRALDAYAQTFGAAALQPRIYDRTALVEGDITADFLAAYLPGSRLTAADLAPAPRSNATLSAESMDLLRAYRAAFHGGRDDVATRDSSRLIGLFGRIDTELQAPRPRLRPEIAEMIDYARPDPLALRDRWGLVFPGLDYARLGCGLRDRGFRALLRERLRPWRLEEIMPIDRDLQQAILDRLAAGGWARSTARAAWVAGLRRGGAR